MKLQRTPGVHVVEQGGGMRSVVEPPTLPAFVGYTEKAWRDQADDLLGKPTEVGSLTEFERLFGGAHTPTIAVTVTRAKDGTYATTDIVVPKPIYLLWLAVRLFYENGGGDCIIVSVGGYADPASVAWATEGSALGLQGGLTALEDDERTTILAIPEAVALTAADYALCCQAMLAQCGTRGDRVAVLDVHGGDAVLDEAALAAARRRWGGAHLSYGAVYYPFVETAYHPAYAGDGSTIMVTVGVGDGARGPVALGTLSSTDKVLHHHVVQEVEKQRVVVPCSGAVVGVYVTTDDSYGVWKAPAGVGLRGVTAPVVAVDESMQTALALGPTGRSINAVRAFEGQGTLVWGARTLDGNSTDWRYVPVRRTVTMVETAVRRALRWAVFEPNGAELWAEVRGVLEHYLYGLWQQGALVGATAAESYQVRCGLGVTMTALDVEDGRLVVSLLLALVRPAEFVELDLSFQVASMASP